MKRIWIIGGTTEARLLAEKLLDTHYTIYISVATEYGIEPLSHLIGSNITILCERLTCNDMIEFVNKNKPDIAIDASHPHALVVTDELKNACNHTNIPYINLERSLSFVDDNVNITACTSIDEAIRNLNLINDEGNVFVATGAKELHKFSLLTSYKKRIYARVLPTISSLEECTRLGLSGSQIFCMQGPFSDELNTELFKISSAKYLVTKNSGDYGGISEKLSAAKKCNISVYLIAAPISGDSKTLEQVLQIIGGIK